MSSSFNYGTTNQLFSSTNPMNQSTQTQTNANVAVRRDPQAPTVQPRPSSVLGGAEKVIDETGEKIKEDFLTFLQRCREHGNGQIGMISSTPTSEMLTMTAGSEPPQLGAADAMPLYVQQLHEMRNEGQTTLYVDFMHLMAYNDVLAMAILDSFYRFEPFLKAALRAFVEAYIPSYSRMPVSNQLRDFWISFYNLEAVLRLRELNSSRIGQLLTVSGTVTRTSEIRPELLVGVFRCDDCYTVVRDVEQQFHYTEPVICPNTVCANARNWTLLTEQSYFVNWQRVRVQENSEEIPPGSMPRCMDIIVRNEMVERAKAGDKCLLTGTLIVIPDLSQLALPINKLERMPEAGRVSGKNKPGLSNDGVTGLKALGVRDLTYRLAFVASMVQSCAMPVSAMSVRYGEEDMLEDQDADPRRLFTSTELDDIAKMRSTPQLYARMVESIAPNIYGHAEIKAGILLMLFGGVHKV